jgi:CBS domain-containing membrane protein
VCRKKLRDTLGGNLFPATLQTATGAFVGIASVGVLSIVAAPASGGSLLVAPLGATAMILFASPRPATSTPYVVLVGNVTGALAGLSLGQLALPGALAAALALGGAIVLMSLLRAMHPPGAGMALVAALAGDQSWSEATHFLLECVLLNSALLVGIALTWHAVTARVSRWIAG